jgi:hypothetical protein
MPIHNDDYWNARQSWLKSAHLYAAKREEYRKAYAAAYIASQGKNHDARKADADIETSGLRLARDEAEINAMADWQDLLVARGPMDASRPPGVKFGEEAA